MAKISGNLSDDARLIIVNESTWLVESSTDESAGNFDISSLASGTKTIIARGTDGECYGYGNVSAINVIDIAGYALGGIYFTVIDKLVFNTESCSAISAVLDEDMYSQAGVNSSTKGYTLGGVEETGGGGNDESRKIESLTFSNDSFSLLSEELSVKKTGGHGLNNSTKGYIAGGVSEVNTYASIEDFTFSTELSEVISAVLSAGKYLGSSACSSTKGYVLGGKLANNNATNVIEAFTFSNESRTNLSATLNTARYENVGVNSSTKGYTLSGYATILTVEDLVFSNETSNQISATLAEVGLSAAGVNSSTKGYLMGRWAGTNDDRITGLTFSNETLANLSAVLSVGRDHACGFQSGGLL